MLPPLPLLLAWSHHLVAPALRAHPVAHASGVARTPHLWAISAIPDLSDSSMSISPAAAELGVLREVRTGNQLCAATDPALGAPDLSVVFFSTRSCPACRRLEPQVRRLAARWPSLRFVRVTRTGFDADAFELHGVRIAPSFLVMERGEVTDRFSGNMHMPAAFREMSRRIESLALSSGPSPARAPGPAAPIAPPPALAAPPALSDDELTADGASGAGAAARAAVLLASYAVAPPAARLVLRATTTTLLPAVVGATAAAIAAPEPELALATPASASSPDPTAEMDWVPLVSQMKSLGQAMLGDGDGARLTQERFSRQCPVVSQCRSLAEWSLLGDNVAARRTQLEQLHRLKRLAGLE